MLGLQLLELLAPSAIALANNAQLLLELLALGRGGLQLLS